MGNNSSTNEKQDEIVQHQNPAALALREVYPAEEFAGFETFGESPEWQPGQAEVLRDRSDRAA